jgi:NAD(P)-dependent dehydrogenase (short-subunit alcohol dehydrogenase family)
MANRKVGDFDVKDKIVLITGGGSGIGLSFVKLCHSKGAKILIGDLKLTAEADKFIKKTGDGSVAFTQCDVSDWKALRKLITTSVETFGEVPDVYCPCAVSPFPDFLCCEAMLTIRGYSSRHGLTSGMTPRRSLEVIRP